MNRLVILALSILVTACGNQEVENAVRLKLKDPSSAQFEGIASNGATVCGFVKAKNSMDGYVSFRAFIVKEGAVELESEAGDFVTRFVSECTEMTTSKYTDLLTERVKYHEKLAKANRPKVAIDAYSLMTPDSYPKMFARLGASRFKEANRKTPSAMDAISQFPSCDGVADGGISDWKTTKQEIHWYAYCYNGVKITVSETDITVK
jgi:hypothetical protein